MNKFYIIEILTKNIIKKYNIFMGMRKFNNNLKRKKLLLNIKIN